MDLRSTSSWTTEHCTLSVAPQQKSLQRTTTTTAMTSGPPRAAAAAAPRRRAGVYSRRHRPPPQWVTAVVVAVAVSMAARAAERLVDRTCSAAGYRPFHWAAGGGVALPSLTAPGPFQRNNVLANATFLDWAGSVRGPESIAVADDGKTIFVSVARSVRRSHRRCPSVTRGGGAPRGRRSCAQPRRRWAGLPPSSSGSARAAHACGRRSIPAPY